jgi:two-component system sensor kinase FixL
MPVLKKKFPTSFNALLGGSRRKTDRRLMESEERFRLLIQHVKDYAIYMIDPEGRVMSWNEGAERIKGYTEAEVIGQPISIFYTDQENQAGEPANNLRRALDAGRYEAIGLRRRKDGSLFCADVIFTPLYDPQGNLRGFAKITRDITEQQRAEEEVRNALKREHELNELKSRFVSLASHEFKTPLSVILSSIALIEKYQGAGSEMDEKRMRHIQRVRANVNNLRQILNDFLSVEKLEEGIVNNSPYEMNMPGFLEEIVQDMNDACKAGQQIDLRIIGQPQMIVLDGQLLRNILNNLLSNAIKYSPDCTSIGFTLRFDPGILTFIVKDNGIGIPPEEQPHLFERFFRATNTAGISGTGLGLSIVKRYVDLMGGTIHLKSAPDTGTEFTVILPSRPISKNVEC